MTLANEVQAPPSYKGNFASAEQEQVARQQLVIQDLTLQIQDLQQKLGELHATDVNSLRRAYKTLAQHVQALDIESKHLLNLVESLEANIITPEVVAHEAGFATATAGIVWTLTRAIQATGIKELQPVARFVTTAGVVVVGLRLLRSAGRRLMDIALRNRTAKQELDQDVRGVRQRIEIMSDLAVSGLTLHNMAPSPQQQPAALPDPNTSSSPSGQQQQQQEGGVGIINVPLLLAQNAPLNWPQRSAPSQDADVPVEQQAGGSSGNISSNHAASAAGGSSASAAVPSHPKRQHIPHDLVNVPVH